MIRRPATAAALAAALAAAGCAADPAGGPVPGWRERIMVEVPRAGGEPCLVERPEPYDPRNWVHDFADWIDQCLRLGTVRPRPRLEV